MLKGIPGTGKTKIGKVICNTIGDEVTFIWVTPGDIDSTSKVKAICELARGTAPSVLFLEDIDLYSKHRDLEPNKGLLGELMNQLDGLIENEFVIVIATTNYPDNVEDAIRNRPGRFDRIIDVSIPDIECRERMLNLFLKERSVEAEDVSKLIKELAKSTEGFTGAHMKELVNSAIISAIDDNSLDGDRIIIKEEHFLKNIELVRTKEIKALGFSTNYDPDELDY